MNGFHSARARHQRPREREHDAGRRGRTGRWGTASVAAVGQTSGPVRRSVLFPVFLCSAALMAAPPAPAAPAADAGCGGPVRARATHRTRHVPLILGDSVMIFAVPALARLGFDADARGCRQVPEALDILRARRRAHALPHLVVLALGTNGYVTPGDIGAVLSLPGPHRVLGLVTPRETGGGSSSDATNIRAARGATRSGSV